MFVVVMALEEEVTIEISDKDVDKIRTVKQMVDHISQKLAV